MGEFDGKTVVITGGISGLGAATASLARQRGAKVIVTALNEQELREKGGSPELAGVEQTVLDVRDDAAVAALAQRVGPIELLVNCAGTQVRGDAAYGEAGFLHVIDINLNGTMRACRAFRPNLAQRRGAIVNLGSVMSFFGSATAPGYSASKGAVVQLTKSLAVAWADDEIRVNAVAPGFITSPMTEAAIDPVLSARVLDRCVQHRWGEARHIAEAILFLGSERAEFITGVTLPVDGGYSAH